MRAVKALGLTLATILYIVLLLPRVARALYRSSRETS